jgi:hypothetical protein
LPRGAIVNNSSLLFFFDRTFAFNRASCIVSARRESVEASTEVMTERSTSLCSPISASSFYTLYPGDILMTGTPEGVGPVEPGDLIEAEVAQIGR